MWWSRALLVVVVLALGPSGCGFRPLYGKPGDGATASPAAAELATVRIAGIEDRSGQLLRNALLQRLTPGGEPAAAQYYLIVAMTESMEGLAATKTGHATIGRLLMTATFSLIRIDGSKPVFGGSSRSVATFRMLGPSYGTVAIERDAQERALSELADDIRSQLAVFFARGGVATQGSGKAP